MRKHSKWLRVLLVLALALFAFAGCGGNGGEEEPIDIEDETPEIPAEVQAVMDHVTSLAANYALQLDGEWADEYVALLESGKGWD